MPFQKLTSTDAFVVTDLAGAPSSTGIVRRARKILPDGAKLLARSTTYAWAVLGQQVGGASAGVNAEDDAAEAALAAFVEEVAAQVADGTLSLDAGKGVPATALGPLDAVDRRNGVRRTDGPHGSVDDELLAVGAVAAAAAALGRLDGLTAVVEGAGTAGAAVEAALAAAGARVVAPSAAGPLATAGDVLFCGSKTGLVDHVAAADLPHRVVVPVGPVPVTARGLAVAHRRGVVVLPDFVTTGGPLLGWSAPEGTPLEDLAGTVRASVAELVGRCLDHPENPTLGGCAVAEDFLRSWQDELPFGRPMA
ncbi:MAG: hypothetical protein ACKO04_12000 [Actinomycetes bacterium]